MFKDKVCVITGGASGIGKAICEDFTKQNARCYVVDIKEGIILLVILEIKK